MFKSKKADVIISIIVAVVLWAYVVGVVDPSTTKIVRDVSIRVTGIKQLSARGLAVSSLDDDDLSVNLTIKGKRSRIKRMDVDRLKAVLDVSECSRGENSISLSYDTPSGISVSESSDESVKVRVVRAAMKKTDVIPEIYDTPKGKEIGNISLSPDVINVSGSKKQLEKVDHIRVRVSASRFSEEGTAVSAEPSAVAKSGKEVPYVTLLDSSVTIRGTLMNRKSVPVNIEMIGTEDSSVKNVEADSTNVTVIGSKDSLKNIDSINGTVDITGVDKSRKMKVNLGALPEGIELSGTSVGKNKNIYVYIKVTKK